MAAPAPAPTLSADASSWPGQVESPEPGFGRLPSSQRLPMPERERRRRRVDPRRLPRIHPGTRRIHSHRASSQLEASVGLLEAPAAPSQFSGSLGLNGRGFVCGASTWLSFSASPRRLHSWAAPGCLSRSGILRKRKEFAAALGFCFLVRRSALRPRVQPGRPAPGTAATRRSPQSVIRSSTFSNGGRAPRCPGTPVIIAAKGGSLVGADAQRSAAVKRHRSTLVTGRPATSIRPHCRTQRLSRVECARKG